MNNQQLFENIQKKGSFLCVGLDTDIRKIPRFLLDTSDPIFAFNKEIIDATAQYSVAYKPNLAFYESEGIEGWRSLEKTVHYLREKHPDIFLIADAKRGDIGNTSSMYARTFFDKMDFDAVTVAPYMGEDSIKPFLVYEGKRVVLLALTSNKGASDFQFGTDNATGEKLFEKVLRISQDWGNIDNLMYVIGATKAEELEGIRKIVPSHFLLVPGVGPVVVSFLHEFVQVLLRLQHQRVVHRIEVYTHHHDYISVYDVSYNTIQIHFHYLYIDCPTL